MVKSFLGISENELEEKGGLHTAREIAQQPRIWQQIAGLVEDQRDPLHEFLSIAISKVDRILITGAGTSAFIGLSLQGWWQHKTGMISQAIATTDLVSHPHNWLRSKETILLISFARSGNSPESLAAIELADQVCGRCFHLIITCNADGSLANFQSGDSKYVIVLPPETNDQSLAMTSSYTSMLLTGLLSVYIYSGETFHGQVKLLIQYSERILRDYLGSLRMVAEIPFQRAVFLGSGCLYGTAVESHLKLQELTDGKVICKYDSFLGFRHGPKAVVDEHTLMVYLFSNQPYALQYEIDLVKAMHTGKKPLMELGIAASGSLPVVADQWILLSDNGSELAEHFLPLCMVLSGQLIGFFKSLLLGLMPDTPSASGAISRVVEGVNIYPFEMEKSNR